jgi:hypothetical protein
LSIDEDATEGFQSRGGEHVVLRPLYVLGRDYTNCLEYNCIDWCETQDRKSRGTMLPVPRCDSMWVHAQRRLSEGVLVSGIVGSMDIG